MENLSPEKEAKKHKLELAIKVLEEKIKPVLDRLSNQKHQSFLQVKQDKKTIAVLRNTIKGHKKTIKLLGQHDLF